MANCTLMMLFEAAANVPLGMYRSAKVPSKRKGGNVIQLVQLTAAASFTESPPVLKLVLRARAPAVAKKTETVLSSHAKEIPENTSTMKIK